MFLGRVIGTVVATQKVRDLEGVRMMLVQPITDGGADLGGMLVAADATQAGPGDVVHLTSSREASMAMPIQFVPVDHAIIAIVDSVGGAPLTVASTWPVVDGAHGGQS